MEYIRVACPGCGSVNVWVGRVGGCGDVCYDDACCEVGGVRFDYNLVLMPVVHFWKCPFREWTRLFVAIYN